MKKLTDKHETLTIRIEANGYSVHTGGADIRVCVPAKLHVFETQAALLAFIRRTMPHPVKGD